MSKQDYYELLEVDRGADEAALKKSYRKMAMKYHPDRNPDDKDAEHKPERYQGIFQLAGIDVRIIKAGGYVALNTGSAPDANAIPGPTDAAEKSLDAAACIGCGA